MSLIKYLLVLSFPYVFSFSENFLIFPTFFQRFVFALLSFFLHLSFDNVFEAAPLPIFIIKMLLNRNYKNVFK